MFKITELCLNAFKYALQKTLPSDCVKKVNFDKFLKYRKTVLISFF